MTLTITTVEDDQRQLKLTVEVSEDRVEQAMRKKARQLGSEVRIPGFRRGKVPYNVIVQRFGQSLVRAEAIEDMVQAVYEEATTEADVDAYGRPSLDDMEIEPLVMKFTIPLEPVVTLGDYREIRKDVEAVVISEEAVIEALEQVQTNHQIIEPVDRAAESGDVLTIGGKGVLVPVEASDEEVDAEESDAQITASADEQVLFDEESVDVLVDGEKLFPGTSFVENLIGSAAGDVLSFTTTFPDDFEDESLAGRTAKFEINVLDVKSRELPALDDELAKLEGDFESIDELRKSLEERLQKEAGDHQKEEIIERMVDDLVAGAELAYPPAAVEIEIDNSVERFRSQVTRAGWDFEDYLKLQNLSEEALREDFHDSAEERLRRQLVTRQFVIDEQIRIKEEDVEALIDDRIGRYENEAVRNGVRDFYLSGAGFDIISSEVLSDKVYQRITEILIGAAPDLDELDEAEVSEEEE